jgi:hypothetical protein
MDTFSLHPTLGLKTDVAEDDPTLFKQFGRGVAAHCVDGLNISFNRTRNATTKSFGYSEWSNSATDTAPSNCNGIFELFDGSNRKIWIAYDGDMFRYDGSRDPQEVADTAATAWASDSTDWFSFMRYGNFMVFSDYGEHQPYCSDQDDANLIPLISSGTAYKGKYLESFQRRILMANITSGITTAGELSVIWSDPNPVAGTSCTFNTGDPPSNHLYLPVDDAITGIKRMGRNACAVYSDNSINSLDYYVDYTNPFGFTTVVSDQGFVNNVCLVEVNGVHYGFNKNYGFCVFDGTRNFPAGGRPISFPIENWIRDIRSSSHAYIVGVPNTYRHEILWTVALEGETTPNAILVYDYVQNTWTRHDFTARFLHPITSATDVTWTSLGNLGYTTWASMGNLRWSDLVNETPDIAFANTDGKLYYIGTEGKDGSAMDGYRVEPILDFGDANRRDLLLEIWFNLVEVGNYSLYVYHRSGDTVGECNATGWTALDEISCDSPAEAVTRLATSNRFHQIKWGTDAASEAFSVNRIDFKYEPQSDY